MSKIKAMTFCVMFETKLTCNKRISDTMYCPLGCDRREAIDWSAVASHVTAQFPCQPEKFKISTNLFVIIVSRELVYFIYYTPAIFAFHLQ